MNKEQDERLASLRRLDSGVLIPNAPSSEISFTCFQYLLIEQVMSLAISQIWKSDSILTT